MEYLPWPTGGEIGHYRSEINQNSAVGIEPQRHWVTEKNAYGGKLRCRGLVNRVNHFSTHLLIFSSVVSVPLWFNFGF